MPTLRITGLTPGIRLIVLQYRNKIYDRIVLTDEKIINVAYGGRCYIKCRSPLHYPLDIIKDGIYEQQLTIDVTIRQYEGLWFNNNAPKNFVKSLIEWLQQYYINILQFNNNIMVINEEQNKHILIHCYADGFLTDRKYMWHDPNCFINIVSEISKKLQKRELS